MATIGAFEAKTHFSSLLERAAQGEEIVITRHGRPVARLVPAVAEGAARLDRAIEEIKSLRRGVSLGGLSWTELRDQGRR